MNGGSRRNHNAFMKWDILCVAAGTGGGDDVIVIFEAVVLKQLQHVLHDEAVHA